MKIGYIMATDEVAREGKPVGYLCRETPDRDLDSGWRVMSGQESQEYLDEAINWALYNASTILAIDPSIAPLLENACPIAFERDSETGDFEEVEFECEDG